MYKGNGENVGLTVQNNLCVGCMSSVKITVEPRCNGVLAWDHGGCLVVSGFSLCQGTETGKCRGLGPAGLPCCGRVLLYPTSL